MNRKYVFIGGRTQGKTRDMINNLINENIRLNNIIDEMEKFLISVKQFAYLDKLKALKEDKDTNDKSTNK